MSTYVKIVKISVTFSRIYDVLPYSCAYTDHNYNAKVFYLSFAFQQIKFKNPTF